MVATTSSAVEHWRSGYGPITHGDETVERIRTLAQSGRFDPETFYRRLAAADRLACAAMWTVVHMTYAKRVDLSGAPLPADAFKTAPEGHTGGSLNMVPAFVGYLTANALSATTRSWLMGQGHCVAAVEAVNALTGDVSDAQKGRYDRSEKGLSQLAADFYSYAIDADGRPAVPIGSHAGPNTAGAISEGGYLGFAEVQYVHAPLPGESLVAFLSDGAFEEQRGSDWTARWWRAEDCGLVVPIMILNGRRIEERAQIAQQGGAAWLADHLRLNGFDPFGIDGRDPAAFVWAILTAEERLGRFAADPARSYPAPIPYAIAETVKGFGFPGAGTNAAHNLPLAANPSRDRAARDAFNEAARALFVAPADIAAAVSAIAVHQEQNRPAASRHPLASRHPPQPIQPQPQWTDTNAPPDCAMHALDRWFVRLVDANPGLRVRVGNPDELSSNHMSATLERLRHRVNAPETGVAEAYDGGVITALNEEAVAAAALANKGGINLIVSYEAFAMKMLGGLRQEIVFARRQREDGKEPGWISVPLVVTSHTWENSKNEQSHQDPTLGEALFGEMSDTARVLFPVDANSAVATMVSVFDGRGQVGCVIVSKRDMPHRFDGEAATRFVADGAAPVFGQAGSAELQIVAIGAYQLEEALKAARRLKARGRHVLVTAINEPGRFRIPRDPIEARFVATDDTLARLFPPGVPRLIVSHTRPEPMLGLLRRLDEGPKRTGARGYISRGGTLDVAGMLFANRCSWAHLIDAAAPLAGWSRHDHLTPDERNAIDGKGTPAALSTATQ
ncbi:D-xylulose 5-phosphate [Bosea sp. 62]|uniref:Xylulose 5-phosphate 3-epimerase n=1 Tax=Hansschlegelia zhihuaiae TaxID=405005 RepID=A0A4Q0MDV9_9HYPH|nr:MULTISPECIES: xylulose 5-phosphate 3-epimerase [Hyphomicrobiales]RXF71435.1 xylulose 5-phosphate 3-epimerase [Hansschlegelia zhihuaiae]CAD5291380.1 D-xylulose 5-phosphate [Bosea sp. 21B]CAD5292530.1 D-xylulose 5-phosphate [Bosea sp. 46]CAD5300121.1 D-xylulose 5-phosphate [Bosea sp. 7B]VVT57205.1 D-xylulose 5-phosphate [Bosea sp. EC-HK365B]